MKPETMDMIKKHVAHARSKHPRFVTRAITFDKILAEEIGEAAEAEIRGDINAHKAELMDAIAVLVRKYEGDDLSSGSVYVNDGEKSSCDICGFFLGGLSSLAGNGIRFCPHCGEPIVGQRDEVTESRPENVKEFPKKHEPAVEDGE